MSRKGVICAGNFIVDHLRMVDAWPKQDMLATITAEMSSNGGGPFNILKDLAALNAPFPLEAVGCVGEDSDGHWIIQECKEAHIDTRQLHVITNAPTSYTQVVCEAPTRRRTFFHRRGANAFFSGDHVDFTQTNAKHFHLAYLMLLDTLDATSPSGRTYASHLLEKAKSAGLTTSVDLVSTENAEFMSKIQSALPYVDYLFINEVEAEMATGCKIKQGDDIVLSAAEEAAGLLMKGGVTREVILHFSKGAYVLDSSGTSHSVKALHFPSEKIVSSNGAGDAFAAGYIYALQMEWATDQCLNLAVCSAAASLRHGSPSAGLSSAEECLELGKLHPAI